MELELVAEGLLFPEGPIAMGDGSVILTEIAAGRLTRITPGGGKEVLCQTGGGPNGAAIGPDGAVWICNNGGAFSYVEDQGLLIPGPTPPSRTSPRYIPADQGLLIPGPTPPGHQGGSIQRFDLATGRLETVYEECDGRRLIGPNDIVFDDRGGFWFTDYGSSTPTGRNFGALCYATPDGSRINRQREELLAPNGIGLSPDGNIVYVADTWLQRLWAFDVAAPGELVPAPFPGVVHGRVIANLPDVQLLDSLAVEAGGKICVATIMNGGITIFDPNGGTEHVAVPDLVTTNICFGGEDMRDAWITASSTGRLYKARWPRPGLKLACNG